MRISSDRVGCVGLKLPLGYIYENFLNALKPASYTVLVDLFIDISHSWSTTLPNITSHPRAWTLTGFECCPGCELSESASLESSNASAMLLLIPRMCLAIIIKFLDAAYHVKRLINLIMGWTLDLLLLMIWTVASLSQ